MQTPKAGHPEVVWLSVYLPFAIVVVMNLFEGLSDQHGNWRHRLIKVGWDTSVLAMGVIGGVFANPGIRDTMGDWYLVGVIGAFVLTLAAAVGVAYIRKQEVPSGRLAFLAVALGAGSLVLPALVAKAY